MGSLERNPSKAKLGKTPRLPSGYFVLDGKVEGGKQTATAAASSNQGGLRRQQSFNRWATCMTNKVGFLLLI